MASTPVPAPAPAKVSWLKHFGQILGKVLGFVSTDAKKIADIAAPVAETLFPQFGVAIEAGKNLIDKIANEAILAEGLAAAAGAATGTGVQKAQAVLANVGPLIDGWVQAKFPGASAVSAASKAGLVSAVVAILNEYAPPPAVGPPAAS